MSFQLILIFFEYENAELSVQFTENKRYKIVIVKTDIKMKFSIFTNLRTSQLPFIDTINTALALLKKSPFVPLFLLKRMKRKLKEMAF